MTKTVGETMWRGMLTGAVAAGLAAPAAATEPVPMRVVIYDYADVPEAALDAGQRTVDRIFATISIEDHVDGPGPVSTSHAGRHPSQAGVRGRRSADQHGVTGHAPQARHARAHGRQREHGHTPRLGLAGAGEAIH